MSDGYIEFSGWSLTPPGSSAPILSDISLRIREGERVLITGPSGGGKSSLIRAIAGLHDPSSWVATGSLSRPRGAIGFVGQEPDEQILFPTIGEEVEFVAETTVSTPEKVRRRVGAALRATGISQSRRHPTSSLSGGEKQRLALASALAGEPSLIVLDEPTASLDRVSTAVVVDAVKRVLESRDATVVLVEHHIGVWQALVDRIVVVANGRIIADGPIDTVLTTQRSSLIAVGVWVPGHHTLPTPTGIKHNAQPVLETRGLVTSRSTRAKRVRVPDLTISEGEVVALVGSNGSGKSTVLRALGGLLEPTKGSVTYSHPFKTAPPHRLAPAVLVETVSSVLQNPAYGFTSERVDDEAPPHERAAVGLSGFDVRHPQSLSGGERRRLALAAALARHPRILFLDEPSFGQDANSWLDLIERLRDFLAGRGAIVVATHDENLVAALAHHVINLDEVTR
ncbi:MAG: ABC transporter ATP-binding protein [Microbacteriaceae bacterium]